MKDNQDQTPHVEGQDWASEPWAWKDFGDGFQLFTLRGGSKCVLSLRRGPNGVRIGAVTNGIINEITADHPTARRIVACVNALAGTPIPDNVATGAITQELGQLRSRVVELEARFDFIAHLERQSAWSERTFGPGPGVGMVTDHIQREIAEIRRDPSDVTEWIDVVLLALDGAWRAGYSPEQIAAALSEKLSVNESRTWPDWRTVDPDKAIEHVRESPAPLTEETVRAVLELMRGIGADGSRINWEYVSGKWSGYIYDIECQLERVVVNAVSTADLALSLEVLDRETAQSNRNDTLQSGEDA